MSDKKEIAGVIFSLPKDLANRIFNNHKSVFVKFLTHPTKNTRIKENMKLIIYVSNLNKSVIGEAIIKKVEFLKYNELIKEHKKEIFLSTRELKDYASKREEKPLLVLILNEIKKYNKEKRLNYPITMSGRYITKEEYNKIK
ncbi:MAG: DUF365 domain-containing protein [archaeon]